MNLLRNWWGDPYYSGGLTLNHAGSYLSIGVYLHPKDWKLGLSGNVSSVHICASIEMILFQVNLRIKLGDY